MAARATAYFEPTVDRNLRLLLSSLATWVPSACPVPRMSSSLQRYPHKWSPFVIAGTPLVIIRTRAAFSALNLYNVRPTAGGILPANAD